MQIKSDSDWSDKRESHLMRTLSADSDSWTPREQAAVVWNSLHRRRMKIESVLGRQLPDDLRMSDVEPEELEWLWPDRIPLGKLTLLAGDPGLGKSFVTCDMAA